MGGRGGRFIRGLDPLTAVAIAVLAVGAVQLVAGAFATGVTIDEPIHADRAAAWLDGGWYVPEYELADGKPDPDSGGSSPYVYGPAFSALAHGLNVFAGNEGLDEISRSSDAYAIRHLAVALLGALAVGAVGVAVAFLTGRRRFGLWAAAGMLALPEWMGQSFFNPKDIPAAAGYTLLTVGLLLALGQEGRGDQRRRIAVGALLAGGVFLGVGTRLSLWVPFLLSGLTYVALRLGQRRLGGVERDGRMDFAVAAGAGAGVAAIAVVYPNVASTPVDLLVESVSGSAEFPWQGVTLTAGQLLSEHPPAWYLPTWIGAEFPLLLGGLAILGAVLGVLALARSRGPDWRGGVWHRRDLGLLLVLQQALLLSAGAVVTGAVMYSGMRQHLYVLPALAILAGVGAARAWDWAAARRPPGNWKPLAIGLLCAALVVPMFEQTLLFPYNYTYVNPVAGIGGVNDRWETDYWVASVPEAISRVPEEAELDCLLVPPSVPCYADQLDPFEDRRGTAVDGKWEGDSAAWEVVRLHAGNDPPSGCEQADDVTRWLRGERVTMAYVLRCAE